MSRRRCIVPGTIWAISRRTTRRHFLFSPDEARQVEKTFWYALAYAAQEHGVDIHAACLMSSHVHIVATDVRGELPRFLQSFHRLLAMSTKALRGWPEEVFNKHPTGMHELLTPEAIVESLAYLMANPVEAFAVRYASEWPGARTVPADVGRRTITATRPNAYFDPSNEQWPERLRLDLVMPVDLQVEFGEERARARIAEQLRRNERAAWDKAKQQGRSFLGARRVRRTAYTQRATQFERFGSRNPQFAAAGDKNAARNAIERIRSFHATYNEALARWSTGDRDTYFPAGTWWMRVHHRAPCRPPP